MRVTRLADYGVRLMTELAARPVGTRVTASELARASDASPSFAAKILQRLVGARLVASHGGRNGGFELGRPAAYISMLEIVAALDGPPCLNSCLPGGGGCARQSICSAQGVWASAQAALSDVLASESLARLAVKTLHLRARQNDATVRRFAHPPAGQRTDGMMTVDDPADRRTR